MKLSKNLFFLFSVFSLGAFSHLALAEGGVGLSSTRLIYHAGSDEERISVINGSTNNAFLIQSWLSDANGAKTKDFIITPPLFVLKPNSEGSLRVTWSHNTALPQDRETLYYLNSKAIPSVDPNKKSNNAVLMIATQSKIKMFVRPVGLQVKSSDASKMIQCINNNGHLKVKNGSPYYVTMSNVKTPGSSPTAIMVPPLASIDTPIKLQSASLSFQTINDFGSSTPAQSCHF